MASIGHSDPSARTRTYSRTLLPSSGTNAASSFVERLRNRNIAAASFPIASFFQMCSGMMRNEPNRLPPKFSSTNRGFGFRSLKTASSGLAAVTVTLANGYGGAQDWIALAAVGASNTSNLGWTYVASTTGAFPTFRLTQAMRRPIASPNATPPSAATAK